MRLVRKRLIIKSIIITRKKAPKFVKKIAKNVALSSAVEVFFHHKAPEGSVVIDVTIIESVESFFRFLGHYM